MYIQCTCFVLNFCIYTCIHICEGSRTCILKIILFLDTSVIHVHVCMTFVRIIGRLLYTPQVNLPLTVSLRHTVYTALDYFSGLTLS